MTEEATNAAADTQDATPCLPGFEQLREAAESAPTGPAAADGSAPRPAASRQSADEAAQDGGPCPPIRRRDLGRFACFVGVAALAVIAVAAAVRLLYPCGSAPAAVQGARPEPDGVPLALLPDTADASAWDVVANMSGTIGGTPIAFRRGIARVNGIDYKLCLDFCRSGSDIYARIAGPAAWIVQVNADGRILRAYPAPKHGRPLKDIFPRRP